VNSFSQNCTIVLVHGAWANSSCWLDIILPLRRHGFSVTAAPIPLTSLTDDEAALQRAIERTTGPVILVGHAYAGAVIATTRDERVKSLVYMAALAPDEGETVADVFYRTAPHPSAPLLAPDTHGFIWMPEEGFGNAMAHRASLDQTTLMAAVQQPIAVQCIQKNASAPAWKAKPSWYLLAEDDRMIPRETQLFMAERMDAKIRSYNVDHSPMLTAPDIAVDVILDAARHSLPR